MKSASLARLTVICGLGVLFAGCSGASMSTARAPVVDEVVPPELLRRVFGADGVETTNAAERRQYVNQLDQSTFSSADYQTTNTPVRLLKVRLFDKPEGLPAAAREFVAQREELKSMNGLKEIEGVKLGDESAAFQSDQGRGFRLIVRRGTKVTSLQVRGADLPADCLVALQDLALHILEEAEKRSPSPTP
jgi:hypothetical protein